MAYFFKDLQEHQKKAGAYAPALEVKGDINKDSSYVDMERGCKNIQSTIIKILFKKSLVFY